jgi:membrane-bound ClpP family serine protease
MKKRSPLSIAAILVLCHWLFGSAVLPAPLIRAAAGQQTGGQETAQRDGYLIRVPLPVADNVAAQLEQQIRQIAGQATAVVAADQRPVLILEFDTSNGVTGQGSELGNCLDLAILLTDRSLQNLYTVAYVPRGKGFSEEDEGPASQLKGHAVLIALACNEIAMHEESALGQAGIDIRNDASLELPNYENIAGRRLKVPLPLARALVDRDRSLFRVTTGDGDIKFVDGEELNRLRASGNVIESTTLSNPGSLPLFTSRELQQMRLIRHRVSSRADLAQRLNLDKQALEGNPAVRGAWQPVQLPLGSFVDSREADWTLRMLGNHLASYPETNLIIVRLNVPGGELEPCLRIAQELASFDPDKVRTVAYVESAAEGPTAIIATACDQILMASTARIGGSGDVPVTEQALEDSRALIKRFAEQKQIDWSLPLGYVDPGLTVSRYRNRNSGQYRLLCEEERLALPGAEQWKAVEEVPLATGLAGNEAARLGISRATLDDFEQVKQFYQLSETPLQLEPSPADKWIESVARELASPWIAAWLLFGAVFLLSTEMSNPGIGIPGFLGTVCLMLFFWSQYLDGNAHWLEIMLFVVGVVFVVLEVFVIPGFGIFGIGGLLMIVVGIVLASQTFIIPRNSEELARLPASLSMVLAAGCGFFAGIFFIRKYLTTMPLFRRIMLEPPNADETISPEQREQRESLVDRRHMQGKTGLTVTPLVPAGKAQIAHQLVDVITDGRLVERGQTVKVVSVTGNRVLVEPLDRESQAES